MENNNNGMEEEEETARRQVPGVRYDGNIDNMLGNIFIYCFKISDGHQPRGEPTTRSQHWTLVKEVK